MIDLHNHVLPGVDDGARNLATALDMLQMAVRQGITHVACTPHANDRLDEAQDRLLKSVFLHVKNATKEFGIPVELGLGSELMVGANILRTLSVPAATYHGAGTYCLVEFPTETPYEIIQNVVLSIRRKGVWPVVAHFERFARAQRNPEQPTTLRQAGAVLTLDAGSLVGQFGPVIQKRAKQLLNWNCIDILASDAHNTENHRFCLQDGMEAAAGIVGAVEAQRMVEENPRRVWDGTPWQNPTETGGQ